MPLFTHHLRLATDCSLKLSLSYSPFNTYIEPAVAECMSLKKVKAIRYYHPAGP